MSAEPTQQAGSNASKPVLSNTVALIGVILVCLATGLCGLMFFLAGRLPDDPSGFQQQLQADTPLQLRLLILGCSAAVLMFVAFVLCMVGLFQPDRPRLIAGIGAGVSFLMLLGVFGVLLVGSLMNPDLERLSPGQAPREAAEASAGAASRSE